MVTAKMTQCYFRSAAPQRACARREYKKPMPSAARRRNMASISAGGNFPPLSSHQVNTAMQAPTIN
jgi:hypothetical protein